MKRASLLLMLALSGCGTIAAQRATDRHAPDTLIGKNIRSVALCAGMPDKDARMLVGPDLGQVEWSFKDTTPAFAASVALLGSVTLGGAESCKMDAAFRQDGTITGVSFPQCTASIFGGLYSDADVLVGNCLRYMRPAPPPAGFNAFTYFLPPTPKGPS